MTQASHATTDVDFFAREVVADPYPMLEAIRSMGPIVHHTAMDFWMVTGFDDIKAVLGRPDRFRFPPQFNSMSAGGVRQMVGHDDQHHHEVRSVWSHDFKRGRVTDYRAFVDELVGELVDELAERLRSGEVVDVVQITRLVPTHVITRLAGVDSARLRDYAHWSDEVTFSHLGHIDPDPDRRAQYLLRARTATEAMLGALTEETERRRSTPTDDLIGRREPAGVEALSLEERVANLGGMMFAGYETTAKLLAHMLVLLARHPDQRALLAADRSLIPGAVEEFLRYCGLVMMLPRQLAEPAEVCGVQLDTGAMLMLMISIANRDPQRWPDPHRLDLLRTPQPQLAFGLYGIHVCLGQWLARLEAECFLNAVLDRVPDWDLAAEADFGQNFWIRGPVTAPLVAA
jgi:cytochrome P450